MSLRKLTLTDGRLWAMQGREYRGANQTAHPTKNTTTFIDLIYIAPMETFLYPRPFRRFL